MRASHILVIDDEPGIRQSIEDILVDEGYRVATAEDAVAARESVRRERPLLALLDIWMPGEDGLSLLRGWVEAGLDFPVVVMSGHGTIETAVEATRLGAWDFIEKPIALAKLLLTIERALEASRLQRENAGLRAQLAWPTEPIGNGDGMQGVRSQLERLAGHGAPVLLQGETGVGKEALARWLHARSPRRTGPFVVLTPSALTPQAFQSVLLGSEHEGRIQPGTIERAHGGVLYLDEFTELDADSQALLADILGRGELVRIGGREPVRFDVRVIAASSHPVEARLTAGSVREDLYFLLNVVPIAVPPLRERNEDLPELLDYYGNFYAGRDRLPYRHFGVAAQNRLRQYRWPGNLRELRNLVQRLLLLGSGDQVALTEVEAALSSGPAGNGNGSTTPAVAAMPFDLEKPLREAREDFERHYLQHRLREAGGSVGKLAQLCGLERTHLYRKLKDLGIDPRAGTENGTG